MKKWIARGLVAFVITCSATESVSAIDVETKLSNYIKDPKNLYITTNKDYPVKNTNITFAKGVQYKITITSDNLIEIKNKDKMITKVPTLEFNVVNGGVMTIESKKTEADSKTENSIRQYTGKIEIKRENGYLRPYNKLELETYLKGVVPREMPALWNQEALKAQAVAARTYALRHAEKGLILHDTTASQVYGGYDWHPNSTKAVEATKGQVLVHNGQLVETYYSSSNGGYVESNDKVWGGKPYPYLKAKPDPYDAISANNYVISEKSLIDKVQKYANGKTIQSITQIAITKKTGGQRAEELTFHIVEENKQKNSFTVSATALRKELGETNLKSVYINTPVKKNGDFTFVARGYGHGVGMSQTGANKMATHGNTYKQILSFYYPNTTLRDANKKIENLPTKVLFNTKTIAVNLQLKTMYVGKKGARAYQTMNKTSESYKKYAIATKLNAVYLSNNWYYVEEQVNGETVRAYVHQDEIQATKPFISKKVYISYHGATSYQDESKETPVSTYKKGDVVEVEYIDNNWYYGYENGKIVYFHEDEVQGSKPTFIGKIVYISYHDAPSYKNQIKNPTVSSYYKKGQGVEVIYIGNNWYYGYEKGQKVYFHEDEVQGKKPAFIGKIVYIEYDGANAYKVQGETDKPAATYKKGNKVEAKYLGDEWYYGYYEGQKVYFHEGEVQGSMPFVGRKVFIEYDGAASYPEKDKDTTAILTYEKGEIVEVVYEGRAWYYGYEGHQKVYFHEDEVMGKSQMILHRVRIGDTLERIQKMYDLQRETIIELNPLLGEMIELGQKLIIQH